MFTLGCDPEIAILNNGVPVSIIGKLGGSKHRPRKVKEGAVQEDNVNAEYNIMPADNPDDFCRRVLGIQRVILRIVRRKIPEAVFSLKAYNVYPASELEHPKAKQAGCEPDFNAWTLKANAPPSLSKTNARSCGGHIHIGSPKLEDPEAKYRFIRLCDFFLGLPSLFMDKDDKRRELYGKAGCFRPKSYGVEYRTLSNFWIFKEETIRWVWGRTKHAHDNFEELLYLTEIADIQKAIDNGDRELAKQLLKEYGG